MPGDDRLQNADLGDRGGQLVEGLGIQKRKRVIAIDFRLVRIGSNL